MAPNRSTKIYRNDGRTNRIVGVMNQLRKDVLLCDVTLITNGTEIPSHKMILAASSPYFYIMFTNSEKNLQNKVTLNGLNSQALSSIVEYVYTSEIEITDGNVQDILVAASLLQITDLRDFCSQFLKDCLNSTNCLQIRSNADLHDSQDFLKDVENFILGNFADVAKSQDFLQLSHEDVSGIISKDELKVTSEVVVFESVLTWVKHDLELRQRHFVSLMKNIRICFLPKEYITKTFLEEPLLLVDDLECKNFIIEAVKCLLPKTDAKPTTIKRRKYQELPKILLVAGGESSTKSVEYYDFKGERWSKLTDMPTGRFGVRATVLNGKVYIVGGWNKNTVDIYDAATDQWIPGVAMQFKRRYLGVTTMKNYIYAVGGLGNEGYLNTVEKFDPETEQWSTVAPMLTRRYTHGVGVIDDILYAVGGYDGSTNLNSVESYNPITNTWTHVKSMNLKRRGVAVGILNGMLYAVGGYDRSTPLKSAEVFNPKTGNWTMIKDMNNCRYGAAVVVTNNLLYVIGGYDGSKYLSSVEVYDPNIMTWSVLPSCMSIGRFLHCAAVIDKFS